MKRFASKLILKYSNTVGVRTEFDRITTVALIFQSLFGQQVLDPQWTWRRHFIHQLLILILFVYVIFGTLECLNTATDLELIAEACYTLVMVAIFPLKMLLFINNRHVFRKLYITTKTTLIDVINADPNISVNTVLRTAKKIVYTLFLIVLVPCSIYELTTLWNYLNGNKILLSRSTKTLMPMITPYYEIAWILHTVFLFQISLTIILDMWFVLLIYFLCQSSDSLVKILKEPKKGINENDMMFSKRLNECLKKFYSIHVKQAEYISALNNMYKWLAFVPLANAAICTCLILLLLSNEVNWRFAPHMMPMFAEIFAYNWFGEQIKTKENHLHKALIDFDWMSLSTRDRNSYLIILTYMNKEVEIKTAIGNLSLVTMSTVLKISYQAFTVLRTWNS